MPTLFSWYIKAHGPVFLAHGIVSGHPKLPEGEAVHTSSLIRAEEEENGLLLETQSGSVYHVRAEEFSARESRPELPPPGRKTPCSASTPPPGRCACALPVQPSFRRCGADGKARSGASRPPPTSVCSRIPS